MPATVPPFIFLIELLWAAVVATTGARSGSLICSVITAELRSCDPSNMQAIDTDNAEWGLTVRAVSMLGGPIQIALRHSAFPRTILIREATYSDMLGRPLWSEARLDQRLPHIGDSVYRNGQRYTVQRFALVDGVLHVNIALRSL